MNNNVGSLDGLTNFYGDNIETSTITAKTATITDSLTVQGLTVGRGSLLSVNTNTAYGVDCLKAKLNLGGANTAVGYKCLAVDVSGGGNSGYGMYALNVSNGGTNNTAIGAFSLFTSTTAKYNCALGYQSLYRNTTGSYNVASGYQASYFNTTSTNNVSSGYQAMYLNTSGSHNSAYGNLSGRSNLTGSYNTFLGGNTDCSGGTAFNNSTAIGYGAKITASNQIKLGTSTETVYIEGSAVVKGRALSLVDSVNDISPSSRILSWGYDDGSLTYDRVYMYASIYSNDFNIVLNPAYINNGFNITNYGSGVNIFTLDMSGNAGISGDVAIAGKTDISGALVVSGNITGNIGYMNRLRLVDLSTSSRLLSWSYYNGSTYADRANIYASVVSNDFNIDLQSPYCSNGFNIKNQGNVLLNVDMSGNTIITGGLTANNGISLINYTPLSNQIGNVITVYNTSNVVFGSSVDVAGVFCSSILPAGTWIINFGIEGSSVASGVSYISYGISAGSTISQNTIFSYTNGKPLLNSCFSVVSTSTNHSFTLSITCSSFTVLTGKARMSAMRIA